MSKLIKLGEYWVNPDQILFIGNVKVHTTTGHVRIVLMGEVTLDLPGLSTDNLAEYINREQATDERTQEATSGTHIGSNTDHGEDSEV